MCVYPDEIARHLHKDEKAKAANELYGFLARHGVLAPSDEALTTLINAHWDKLSMLAHVIHGK